MKKIKNSQLLLSHGNISAREKVLTLTDEVLDRLDSRERLKQMIKRTGDTLVIGDRRIDLNLYDNIYAFSSGKAGNHIPINLRMAVEVFPLARSSINFPVRTKAIITAEAS